MKRFLFLVFLLGPLLVSAATLRLEGDRAWLESQGAPLSEVLRLFEQRGVEVLIDPSLQLNRGLGEWENTKVDRLIGQLVSPNSYLLEWRRMDSPLGELYQIASIRIYSTGNPATAQPLSNKRKVLDIVEGKDGVKYILEDNSWLLIRPSGTEPVLRVYAEGSSEEMVQALLTFGESIAESVT